MKNGKIVDIVTFILAIVIIFSGSYISFPNEIIGIVYNILAIVFAISLFLYGEKKNPLKYHNIIDTRKKIFYISVISGVLVSLLLIINFFLDLFKN